MVFRKFRPGKQWGVYNTRIFKEILTAKCKRKMPSYRIPDSLKTLDVAIYDPNDENFPRTKPETRIALDHSLFRTPKEEDHPLFKRVKCLLYDASEPFTDGIDQACALTKAIKRSQFPESLLAEAYPIENLEAQVKDFIMHGERYDPTLEKLPKWSDPVIFWRRSGTFHGTPIIKRSEIILDNIFRSIHLNSLKHGQLEDLRCDRDEPISGILEHNGSTNQPLVVRGQPHLVIQCSTPLKPWLPKHLISSLESETVPDVYPIHPFIDFGESAVYNDTALIGRRRFNLHLDTIMWAKEQDLKYPWTREQNAANAVMYCFGAALIEATRRRNKKSSADTWNLENPIVTRAVQLVNGIVDMVVFQLNTLDLRKENSINNIVWIEHGQRLYKTGKHIENYDSIVDLNIEPYIRLTRLLLTR